jgi:hypothetical protein
VTTDPITHLSLLTLGLMLVAIGVALGVGG